MRIHQWIAATFAATMLVANLGLASRTQAGESAKLETFSQQGETFYALSLMPNIAEAEADSSALVVMVDTSASQQGAYRDVALKSLESLLTRLRPSDQVQVWAVDLDVKPVTKGWQTGSADAMPKIAAGLKNIVPLGSTDLDQALRSAAEALSSANADQRGVIYIGDGVSVANLLDTPTLDSLVGTLRQNRVSVTSHAIGPRTDSQLLAILANQTGGNLYVQPQLAVPEQASDDGMLRVSEVDIRNAELGGKALADWSRATVLWPTNVELDSQLGQTYPSSMPPLRADRDTILVGVTPEAISQSVTLSVIADSHFGPTPLSWTAAAAEPKEDNSYLTKVVDIARGDEGLSLPTLGSAGLAETARLVGAQMDQLTELAERAYATGDKRSAGRIAQTVLRTDPGNVRAQTVQNVVEETIIVPPNAIGDGPVLQGGLIIDGAVVTEGANDGLLEATESGGALLDQVEQERRVVAEILAKEVQNALTDARTLMSNDPVSAIQDLKLSLESVRRAPDLDAAKRAELVGRLQAALKEANYQASLKDELDRLREEELASIRERKMLNADLQRQIDKEDQLLERFEALIDEQRYLEAGEVAFAAEQLDPDGVAPRVASLWARSKRHHYLQQVARAARWQAFFDSMYQVELSHIPFPDNPPIIYPDAEVWQDLTNRRKKYASVDLSASSESEERIQSALRQPLKAPLDFTELPLNEVFNIIQDEYQIPIQIDTSALDEVAISADTEVSINIFNVSLRSALNLLFKQPGVEDLTYVIDEEVLLITTEDRANSTLKVKVYPVADLVLPVENLGIVGGGGGGLGGGGGGGLGGGGGGGLGGGGGGGFGGGGGGGLGGGGGGGGFFNVADDQENAPANPQPTKIQPAETETNDSLTLEQNRAGNAVSLSESMTDWNKRFAQGQLDPAAVRATVRKLMKQRDTQQTIGLINAALRNGQSQTWMYETLGIAMQVQGEDKSSIERAIMSACDFSNSPDELMLIAQYLSHLQLDERAIDVYRQVIKVSPLHWEAYGLAMRAAQRTENLEGIRWSTLGILSQAWPRDQQEIYDTARRLAEATLEDLKSSGQDDTYQAFQQSVKTAMVRDIVVKASWAGEADIDIIVEEPGGSVCSLHEPRSAAGGIAISESYNAETSQQSSGLSEYYVCAKAFAGKYQVRVRKIWGDVVADKVTLDVYLGYGTENQKHERQRINVFDNEDSMVVFNLDQGRRLQPLKEQELQVAIQRQEAISNAALAQQLSRFSDPTAATGLTPSDRLRRRLALGAGGAVGFQPIIITLPAGTQMVATGVVSADRRYVRISTSPSFTGIGDVQTFTFAGEAQTAGGGGGGGFGGGGGGFGGGGGGGFGGGGGGI